MMRAPMLFILLAAGSVISSSQPVKTECDAACLEFSAMSGDSESALKLADAMTKTNHEKMVFWYGIAAENGSKIGQYNFAFFMTLDSKNRSDCARAAFWFGKAADQGDSDANEYKNSLLAKLKVPSNFMRGCQGEI